MSVREAREDTDPESLGVFQAALVVEQEQDQNDEYGRIDSVPRNSRPKTCRVELSSPTRKNRKT